MNLKQSAHTETFARDNLPPVEQWPDFLLDKFPYPDRLNAGFEFTDAMVEAGFGDHTALIGNGRQRTYKELTDWTNRLAHVLVDDLGVKPGSRVLIRSANNPAMVACWLAATKAGAVVINSMPMLRADELNKYVDIAEIEFGLCDMRLMEEMEACAAGNSKLKRIMGFDGTSNHEAELDQLALEKPVKFDCVETSQDDVALLGFTSGSTGVPKATMHFHRDLFMQKRCLVLHRKMSLSAHHHLRLRLVLAGWLYSRSGSVLPLLCSKQHRRRTWLRSFKSTKQRYALQHPRPTGLCCRRWKKVPIFQACGRQYLQVKHYPHLSMTRG